MAKMFVSSGAILICSLGTMKSTLKVSEQHRPFMYSGNLATIADNIGMINIPTFQMCKRTLPNTLIPCTPETCMKWINGKNDFKINGEPALLNTCILPCIYGGIIKIQDNSES